MSNADIRGRFIWHELVTTDPAAAGAFYSKVVPWKTQDSPMPSYTLWMVGKTRVGGLTGLPDCEAAASTPPHWIVYMATPDVDATVAAAERLGGKVLKSASDIPNIGRFAILADPQGATFAVYTPLGLPPEGSGSPGPGGLGEFTWHELATTDYAAALSFYVELFGWEKGPGHDMGTMGIYQLINHHGAQVGGIYNLEKPSTPPHWLSYVRVANCDKATTAAKAAGGQVLHGPIEVPGGSWISMLKDPQGGAFAVVQTLQAQAQKPAAKVQPPKVKVEKSKSAGPAKSAKAVAAPKAAKSHSKGRKPAAKKTVAKKSAAKKAGKTAAKKRPAAKRASVKSSSAKRAKSAAKRSGVAGKRARNKKAKRRR
jgi:uncharacterized protein